MPNGQVAAQILKSSGHSTLDVIALGAGAGAYALTVRDLVRRGRLHRQKERLLREGQPR